MKNKRQGQTCGEATYSVWSGDTFEQDACTVHRGEPFPRRHITRSVVKCDTETTASYDIRTDVKGQAIPGRQVCGRTDRSFQKAQGHARRTEESADYHQRSFGIALISPVSSSMTAYPSSVPEIFRSRSGVFLTTYTFIQGW